MISGGVLNNNFFIGAVVVLFNPKLEEILNINSYVNNVDFLVIIDNSDTDHYNFVLKNVSSRNLKYYTEKKT